MLVQKETIFNWGTSQPWGPGVNAGRKPHCCRVRTSSLTPRGCVLGSGFSLRITIRCERVLPDPGAGDFSTGRKRVSLERSNSANA